MVSGHPDHRKKEWAPKFLEFFFVFFWGGFVGEIISNFDHWMDALLLFSKQPPLKNLTFQNSMYVFEFETSKGKEFEGNQQKVLQIIPKWTASFPC